MTKLWNTTIQDSLKIGDVVEIHGAQGCAPTWFGTVGIVTGIKEKERIHLYITGGNYIGLKEPFFIAENHWWYRLLNTEWDD